MASINKKVKTTPKFTHEGGRAKHIDKIAELRRSVLACMLWENSFYESGVDIAARIHTLVGQISDTNALHEIAVEARSDMKLRHAPLFIARSMLDYDKHRSSVSNTLREIIQRPDELSEFVAIYDPAYGEPTAKGRAPMPAQMKKGLAAAFQKFDEYALSKYKGLNRGVSLRDVLFLTHPKPVDAKQASIWKKLANNQLDPPDTWEVSLSGGADKCETFTRLIENGKLGALALLRNLRNMEQVGVDPTLIKQAINAMSIERVLPFRFITAAKHAPAYEPELEQAMYKCINGMEKLEGRTVLVVDTSGSMYSPISAQSQLSRWEAAAGLAILLRELCADVAVYTFSDSAHLVRARRGFALRDEIEKSPSGGTQLQSSLETINGKENYDRIIVITDEQSADGISKAQTGKSYVINVAAYKNGIGYGDWHHIDGWSEAVITWMQEFENAEYSSRL